MKALTFDTETTGIRTPKNPDYVPRLVQVAAILQDTDSRRVLGELNLINECKGFDIPIEASNIHGISQELANSVGVRESLIDEAFAALLAKADLVVAHNIAYDLDVVQDNMPQSQLAIQGRGQFCTMIGSVYIVKTPLTDNQKVYFTSKGRLLEHPYKHPSLTQMYEYLFGEPLINAHDAMADARACRDSFFRLLDEGFYELKQGWVVPGLKLEAAMQEINTGKSQINRDRQRSQEENSNGR